MATARKRPGDYTGLLTQEGNTKHQEELKKRAQEISMLAAVEQSDLDIPIDYSQGPVNSVELEVDDEIQVHPATLTVRLVADLESTTFGAGHHYENMKDGQMVTLPYDFARHLMSKNLVWDGRFQK